MSHKDLISISSRLMIFPTLAQSLIPETYEKFCHFTDCMHCCRLDWRDRADCYSKRNPCHLEISHLANDRNPVWISNCVQRHDWDHRQCDRSTASRIFSLTQ